MAFLIILAVAIMTRLGEDEKSAGDGWGQWLAF